MTQSKLRTRSPRLTHIWAEWQQHVELQQASGLGQSAWCRENGVNLKYLSLWKSKLGKSRAAAEATPRMQAVRPTLVPVVIRSSRSMAIKRPRDASANSPAIDSYGSVNVTLPNGVGIVVQLSTPQSLPSLIAELAHVLC